MSKEAAAEEPESSGPATGFRAVVRREVGILTRSSFGVLFLFLLPVASLALLAAILYDRYPRDMPIAVCDNDHSSMSRRLIRMADASSAMAVAAKVTNLAEGAELIRRGRIYAVLLIPSNFDRDARRGDAPPVTVFYNNQWLLSSGAVSRAAREVVATLSAGLDIKQRMARGESPAQAKEHYDPIRLDTHPLFNPEMDYQCFLASALLPTVLHVFVMLVCVRALGTELRYRTAREWLQVAGGRPFVAVTGKLFPYVAAYSLTTALMLVILVRFCGVVVAGSLPFLGAASLLFVLAHASVGFGFLALSANLRLASSMAAFYVGPAFAFIGVTYPYMAMPLPAQVWSSALPLTHYLRILAQQTLRGAPVDASLPELGILLLFTGLPLLLVPRMGRLMRDERYWGRL